MTHWWRRFGKVLRTSWHSTSFERVGEVKQVDHLLQYVTNLISTNITPDWIVLQWASEVVYLANDSIKEVCKTQLDTLTDAITYLDPVLINPTSVPSSILPRPIFFLLGHVASSVFLLEHASWSFGCDEELSNDRKTHVLAFARWVDEGPNGCGLVESQKGVEKTRKNHALVTRDDKALVYPKL